jgi:succinoglycan biosynthesis transport protein ExoP
MDHRDLEPTNPYSGGGALRKLGSPRQIDEVPFAATVTSVQDASLTDLARAIWRHRRAILLAMVLFTLGTGLYISRQGPMYAAQGAVVIASRKVMIPGLEAVSTPTGDIAIIRSEMAALRSRTLLNQVATALHLDANREFNALLRPEDDDLFAWLDPRPFLRQLLQSGAKRPPIDEHDFVAASVEATLQKNLSLINDERDYVITINYSSQSPEVSAAIVNTLMDKYLEQYAQIKIAAVEDASTALNARAEDLRREVVEADKAVTDFTRKNDFVETRAGSVNRQQLEDLNTQLSTARADRAAAEARFQQAMALSQGTSAAANTDVLASPLIQRLREQEAELSRRVAELSMRLGSTHPDRRVAEAQLAELRETIRGEIVKVTTSLKGQARVARSREAGLEARVAQLSGAAFTAETTVAEFQRLKQAADDKRKVYAGFLAKLAETAKPGDRQPIEARIISHAVAPIEPASARALFYVLLAGIVGGLAAVAGCLAYDQLDHGFETLDQLRAVTGLPAFVAIPAWPRGWQWSGSARYLVDHPQSALAETLRGTRTRLRSTAQDPRAILVTSALSGEGKTSFALALAQVTAIDGWRTLLIECDFHRPILRSVLPPSPSTELTEILAGTVPWQDWVRRDKTSGVFYLVAAHRGAGFPATLEKQGTDAPIGQMKTAFDYVIIDSPPVMRVPDATVLARFADSVLLLVAANRTRQRVVAEALRRLMIAARPLGVVLTNNSARRHVDEDMYTGYRNPVGIEGGGGRAEPENRLLKKVRSKLGRTVHAKPGIGKAGDHPAG